MKKKIFTIALFTLFVSGLFTACNSPSNISGEFNKENYVVSIDDTIDFLEELSLKGIGQSEIELSSSNESVMLDMGQGKFKANDSGETYIFAKNNEKIIAKTKVSVKYKFSSPKNIEITENGTLNWDKSFTIIENTTSFADEYLLTYAKYDENNTLGQRVEEIITTNSFTFAERGTYNISLQALGNEEKDIDASTKIEKIIYYGVMGAVEETKIEAIEIFGQQTATFTWLEKADAIYDVYIEGFKMFADITDSSFSFDYSIFESGANIEVAIVAKDNVGDKMPTTSTFTLTKLETPVIEYKYDGTDGYIYWAGVQNASSYKIKITDFDGNSFIQTIETVDEIKEFLSEYEGGAYNIEVIAVGQGDANLYLNSNPSQSITFGKIQIPNVQVGFAGKSAVLTFNENNYSNKYKIFYGDNSFIYNTQNGFTTTINLSNLPVGKQRIAITALPIADSSTETGVSNIQYEEIETPRVINSNAFIYDFYILNEIGNITHRLNQNVSTLIFNEIENANTYNLYVNDGLRKDVNIQINSGKVNISLENLYQITPVNNGYTFKVVCSRIENGVEIALRVEKTKTLSILDVVTETEQENQINGYFSWEGVEGACEYYYELYKTDSNYQILTPNSPSLKGTTKETVTPELEYGNYYTIRVYTKSTDKNLYLDADFVDKNAFFTKNFIVTKQIETPQVKFVEDNGTYKLEITGVEFGGKYEINVDGALDGYINVSEPLEKFEYIFANTFDEAKVYDVSITAKSGLTYDSNLYLNSEEYSLTVERLANPEFTMDYVRDIYGRKTNENLTFSEISQSQAVEVKLNSQVISDEGYVLDLMDYSKFGSEFSLQVKYIASNAVGDSYYINSQTREIKFERAIAPSSISFYNGLVKWINRNTQPVDHFEGVLALINSKSVNDYITFQVSNDLKEYDLQALIDELIANNSASYRQAEQLQIQLYAFSDGISEEVYKLPSVYGSTTKGKNILDIVTLEKPVLTFDSITETISWEKETDYSTYDIYVDDLLAVEGHSSNSITLKQLGDIDYLNAKRIKVQALNSSYLDSPFSDEITIEEIEIGNSLSIAKTETSYLGTVAISTDQTYINEVWVNGSNKNVNYVQGESVASFDFANFVDTREFEIVFKAKNEGQVHYYIDSKPFNFTIENLADKTLTTEFYQTELYSSVALFEDNLRWSDFRDDFIGNSLQPIVYTVNVVNGENKFDFTVEECEFNLENIETFINAKLVGEVEITITASVEKDYTLTDYGTGIFGYYGNVSSTEIVSSKLEQGIISEVKVYEETRNTSPLKQKMFAGLEVIFEDKWSDYENANFLFTWQYPDSDATSGFGTFIYKFTKDDIVSGKLSLTDGYYHAFIRLTSYNAESLEKHFFDETPEYVSFRVVFDQAIDSTETEFEVCRFKSITGSTISDEGILTLNDDQTNASYFIELKIADKVIYKSVHADELNAENQVDLMTEDFFAGIEDSGNYEINIIAFDKNEKILPSASAEKIEGYKLAGINSISIDDKGNINFSLIYGDYENLVFTAKSMRTGEVIKKDFNATQAEDSTTDYYISMIEILELFKDEFVIVEGEYTFEFTVRQAGSINANWTTLTFNYSNSDYPIHVRGRDLENDYILFAVDNSSVQSTIFSVEITGYYAEETITTDEETNEDIVSQVVSKDTKEFYISPADILGYWITDIEGNNGYYASEKGSETSLIYSQYYVIDLRTLLQDIVYGDVEIVIARVGKSGETYYQYNKNTFNLYKINKINDDATLQTDVLRIENNYLLFNWQQQDANASSDVTPSAYYIVFEDTTAKTSKKVLVTSFGIDLRTVELKEGHSYDISVIAINYNKIFIASNQSAFVTTMRYNTPVSLDVVNGQIVFNVDEYMKSDFMQDIINYFAQTNPTETYHNMVGLKSYTTPFAFLPQTLQDTNMHIKFTSVVEGGATNVVYTGNISASALMPDVEIDFASSDYADSESITTMRDSYVDLLRKYDVMMLENDNSIEALNTKSMIYSITHSNLGIGDGIILIDDIARNLPAGEYLVTISQKGESNYIESEYSKALKIYISASPELSLQTETVEGKTYYTAIVSPTMNMINTGSEYSKQLATRYKMQLRYQPVDGMYYHEEITNLIIGYSGSEWHISYNDTNLVGVISNVASTGDLPKFKINMNALRHALIELGAEDKVMVNTLITVNIFTYSQDDGYVVNGKSAKFNIKYLDLKTEEISFNNGEFIINASLDSTYEVLIRYKLTSQSESSISQNFQNGIVRVSLDKSGVYEYVVLSLNGSISSSTMNIASDSYVIKGLYKLNAPTLTTRNNNINIAYNPNDIRYMSTLKFNMANDISLKDVYTGVDSGYYYQSDLTSAENYIPYVVGSRDFYGDTIYPSELMAEEFFAYLNGNSGTFAVSDETVTEGDILLVFSEERAIMSSPVSSIEAIMLPYLADFKLYGGDFYLDDRMVGINAVSDANFNYLSANIVYEIIVKYYGFDNTDESMSTLMKLHEETHYSERNKASEIQSIAQIVSSSFINTNYDYFTLSITVLGALRVSEDTPNAIKTIENTYILLSDTVYYGPNTYYTSASYGQQVLRSQSLDTPILTRTPAPYLAEGSSGVMNGKIHFAIDISLFYAEGTSGGRGRSAVDTRMTYEEYIQKVAQDTANRMSIVAEYSYGGGTVQEKVGGSIYFSSSSEAGKENDIYVAFTPSEGSFSLATGTIKFYITIYGNSAITSVPLIIDNVYKLPTVNENYYTVELVGEKTYLNFSKYFENVSIANDFSCYKVVILYMLDGDENVYQEEITSTSPIKRFELYSNATILSIQAQDGQDYTTLNPKKLLYSDSTVMQLNKTSIDGLIVTWNPQKMRFEWAWEDGRTDEYDYYISVYVSGKNETEIVNTNYYMPQNRGIISNGGFEIRARKKSTNSQIIYSFSDRLVYEGDEIAYSIYSGGNGSASNPYIIANATDFANIALRNSVDKQFYFKLDNNITINIQNMFTNVEGVLTPIMPQFYGVLDGNGYKITVVSSLVTTLSGGYSGSIIGMSSLNFDQYSSIFHTISSVAKIENLFIDYQISYNSLNTSNIMFSSIATYNYGTLDNVHLTSFTISNLSGKGNNNVFVGGLVAVNYGKIENCANTASFTYLMAQQLSINFGFGGICIFNDNITSASGTIINCFNQGEKQVTLSVSDNLVYMAGIAITNSGKISTSGNDGNFKLSARGAGVTTFTGYYAGITISSNNGTLEYLYNNGVIENISSYGTLNYGGIAYAISGGTINTLVVTVSGQPIVKSCTSKPNSVGNNYASQNSGTHTLITTKELSAQTINCGNGFTLTINQSTEGFKASIASA